jgi:polar amino acid transport system substrate-binding protein
MVFRCFTFFLFLSLQLKAQQTADTLIVGVNKSPPFIITQADGTYSGISVQLWENIARTLDLTYRYEFYDLETLLEKLENNEIAVSINPLTITSERITTYDFTQPFYITNLAIATMQSSQNVWLAFVNNFFSVAFFQVVAALFVILLAFGVLVWLFERDKNREQFDKSWRGIFSGLWWSAVTMTTVGYGDKAPVTTGGRIIGLIWMFTAIIIISGFTASIASTLTVSSYMSNIRSVYDLEDLPVATVNASSGEAFLGKINIGYRATSNLQEALDLLKEGEVRAVVYDEPLLRYTIKNQDVDGDSEMVVLDPTFTIQYYGFAFPKGSDLPQKINPVLIEEINSDSWQVILQRYNLVKK